MKELDRIMAAAEIKAFCCPNCLNIFEVASGNCPHCGQRVEPATRYNIMHKERVALVRAMETICRNLNDERIINHWLMEGVADGDIKSDTTDFTIHQDYCDDETFIDLMDCFLECMAMANKSGGLFCGGVTSTIGEEEE